ncbi:MAG: hypothetical protein L0Y72_05705 [Gemmataceae bacterium]|nr:hypothetical protein [Gemmataceae bacterium]MCI0738519.1 hypothetical protein [Gemmataceae bacterium]
MKFRYGWLLVMSGVMLTLTGCHQSCSNTPAPSSPSSSSTSSASCETEDCCTEAPSRAEILAKSQNTEDSAPAQDGFQSGPAVGEDVPGPFHPLNVTGEHAGKTACLYCANGGNPVAVVFAREVNPTVATLLKKLDEATIKNGSQNMGSYAVFCSDQKGLAEQLKDMAGKQKLQKLVLSIDNPAGPKSYEIAKDAEVTVLLYTEFNVKANHAFKKGELAAKDIDRVVADVSKIVSAK